MPNFSAISVYKSISSIVESGTEKISTTEALYKGTEMLDKTVRDIQEKSGVLGFLKNGRGLGRNVDLYA